MGHGELCTLALPGTCNDVSSSWPKSAACFIILWFAVVLHLSLQKASGAAEGERLKKGNCAPNLGPDPEGPWSHLGPHSSPKGGIWTWCGKPFPQGETGSQDQVNHSFDCKCERMGRLWWREACLNLTVGFMVGFQTCSTRGNLSLVL